MKEGNKRRNRKVLKGGVTVKELLKAFLIEYKTVNNKSV